MRRSLTERALFLLFALVPGYGVSADPLVAGADRDYAPFSYLEQDEPIGFDIEFAELLAESMGRDFAYRLAPWGEIHRSLREGEIDVVLGALHTPAREEYLSFTNPYNTFEFSLVVHESSKVSSVRQMDGRTMAYLEYDAVPEILLRNAGVEPVMVPYPSLSRSVEAVAAGDQQFTVAPRAFVHALDDSVRERIRVIHQDELVCTYRIGVRKALDALLPAMNRAIAEIVSSPEYAALQQRWFEVSHEPRAPHVADGTADGTAETLHVAVALIVILAAVGAILSMRLRAQ